MANGDSSSTPNAGGKKVQTVDPSLAVQFNGNIFPFDNNPGVLNESPATKKSYSWNRGDVGNGNGPK